MRLSHVNLVARDGEGLTAFYVAAFGMQVLRARRLVDGPVFFRGMGLARAFHSTWLGFPEGGPFLEIFDFDDPPWVTPQGPDAPGLRHLAFRVTDLAATRDRVLAAGGSAQGSITNLGSEAAPVLAVYLRDPEGNLLELEQA